MESGIAPLTLAPTSGDYLTIPADQIKDNQPVMTLVGGRIVHEKQ